MDNTAQSTTPPLQPTQTNNQPTPTPSPSPKRFPLIFIFLALTLLFLLGVVVWYIFTNSNKPPTQQNMAKVTHAISTTSPTPTQANEVNIFQLEQAKVGATINGLKVKSVGPYKENINIKPNSKIVFEGKITLTGQYIQSGPSAVVPITEVCFEKLEPSSEVLLPKLSDDTRATWFCFNNPDNALQKLKVGEQNNNRTIEIENYTINHYPSEVYNTADLVRVTSTN